MQGITSVAVSVGTLSAAIGFDGDLTALKAKIADRVHEYTGSSFALAESGIQNVGLRWSLEINFSDGQVIMVSEIPMVGHNLPTANELMVVFRTLGIYSLYYMTAQIAGKTCELMFKVLDQYFPPTPIIIFDDPIFPSGDFPIIVVS